MEIDSMQMAAAAGHTLSHPATWVDRYGDFLFSHALSHVRNRVVAEELVEETFLNALRSRTGFTGGSPERTWLVGLLRRNMFDYFRRVCSDWPASMDDPALGESPLFEPAGERQGRWRDDQAPGEWRDPAKALDQKEFADLLRRCVDNLPLRLWSVFTLREIDGASSTDICMELGISPDLLRVCLYRARISLRSSLETGWFRRR